MTDSDPEMMPYQEHTRRPPAAIAGGRLRDGPGGTVKAKTLAETYQLQPKADPLPGLQRVAHAETGHSRSFRRSWPCDCSQNCSCSSLTGSTERNKQICKLLKTRGQIYRALTGDPMCPRQ